MRNLVVFVHVMASSVVLLAGVSLPSLSARAATLEPPFDASGVQSKVGKADKRDFSCGQPPPAQRNLQFYSMYKEGDDSHSIIDPKADAAYKEAYKPIAALEKGLTSMANRFVRSSPPRSDIAACTLEWIDIWAEGNAMLGDVNKNGEYIRKWLIASVSNSWFQIKDDPKLDPDKKKEVLEWIHKVGKAAQDDFSRDPSERSRQNNHLYWAAWGVASAAIATNDHDMFDWAMGREKFGISQIQPDGSLPLEVLRKKKAWHYHVFAAAPLFMLAEAGYRNGVDLFHENDEGLHRLGSLILKNIGHPDDFKRLTGEEQETDKTADSSDLNWVEVYARHYHDPLAESALEKFRPLKTSRMGGDVTLLYAGQRVKEDRRSKDASDGAPQGQ
jgi:poly(beta-D-mannuronate) lyase